MCHSNVILLQMTGDSLFATVFLSKEMHINVFICTILV